MGINPEHYFVLSDNRIIKSLEELIAVLKTIDRKTFEYHVNDSKNDFANWIKYVFKNRRLADNIESLGYEEIQKMILLIQHHMSQLNILVINGGSSSLKFQLIDLSSRNILMKGMIDAIGLDRCVTTLSFNGETLTETLPIKNHDEAIARAIRSMIENDVIGDINEIKAIGHRVVHGGETYAKPVVIDNTVIERLKELSVLAPLHNPANISCILACQRAFTCPQVAVFDTAFHSTIPVEKYLYGLPYEYYEKHKIRKYGFHGSSHKYVTGLIGEYYRLKKKRNPKIIICHLGNGSSITAVKNGKSLNTTMGFTPLDGLIMGTRCGHLDPAVAIHLGTALNMNYEQLGRVLNKQSGLLGISGYSDMRDLRKTKYEKKSKLAMDMFADRITHYIGAYVAELGGVDGIVFTAGIGENAFYIRKAVLDNFRYLGLKLDSRKNVKNEFIISAKDSKVTCFVVATNEELQIAMETRRLLKV
jgi:acetate kinase